jgi:hypothetical protein
MSRRSQRRINRRKAELRDPWEPKHERRGRKAACTENLTDELVSGLAPKPTEYAVHDFERPGLFVRVRPSGNRSFYYRPHGSSNKKAIGLGSVERLTVSDARLKAKQVDRDLVDGTKLSQVSSRASAGTVKKAFDAYRASWGSPSGWIGRIEREFTEVILPIVGDLKLASLTHAHLDAIIRERATYYGRRNLRIIISSFLSWCVRTGRIDANVLKGGRTEPRPAPRKRRNFYGPELRTIWDACATLPHQWRDAFRMVIASGLPVHEVLSLPANALDIWGDEAYRFGPLATELIQGMAPTGTGCLFSAPGKFAPMTFQQGMLKRLCNASGLGPFTPGDLQRSSISVASIQRGCGFAWNDFLPPFRDQPPCQDSAEL